MALSIINVYDQEYISKMGIEYVCTGFMFDVPETNKTLGEQMASFDFIGVNAFAQPVGGEYNMSPSGEGTNYSAGNQTGGMGY